MTAAFAMTRRQLMSATAAGVLTAVWPRFVGGQPQPLELTPLGADLALVEGAGANLVVLETSEGLLLADGGAKASSTALRKALAERWVGAPVSVVFNTNWREEHSGANAAYRSAGATVMAHENTKLWLGGDFYIEWEDRHHTPQPATEWPNETFYTSGKLDLGGSAVEYWYLPRAHTDGDVAVFFPHANVLVVSDLLAVGGYPIPDYSTGGWIGGLVDATQQLLDKTDAGTRIVAARGGVFGRAELAAQLEVCTTVRQKVAEAFRVGMSLADFIASKPTAAFDARCGDPRQFLPLVYKGAFAHLRELGGVI
jgi:glyoxylase-like metal-dependent hydrolase (beta-lactamase superfamily II)